MSMKVAPTAAISATLPPLPGGVAKYPASTSAVLIKNNNSEVEPKTDISSDKYRKMFDVDGDGIGPLEEIMMKYDTNHNASFSPAEVKHIIKDMQASKSHAKKLSLMVMGLVAVLVLVCIAMFGVTFGAVEFTKESHTEGDTLVNLAGAPVKVDTVESFSTLWDLTEIPTETLAHLKSLTLNVNMTGPNVDADLRGLAEMTIKVAGAYRPSSRGGSGILRVTSSEGYIVKLNAGTKSATITMGTETFALDAGELDTEARRRRLLSSASVRLLSREAFVKKHLGVHREAFVKKHLGVHGAAATSERRLLQFEEGLLEEGLLEEVLEEGLLTCGSFTMVANKGLQGTKAQRHTSSGLVMQTTQWPTNPFS